MTRGVFGLALLVGGVSAARLAMVTTQEPRYESPPRLVSAIDGGSMEDFLAGPEEKAMILEWVEQGAPQSAWPDVSAVLEARCVTCHFEDEEQFEMLALDRYRTAASATKVRSVLEEKITGGTMGEYLQTAAEQSTILDWIAKGAPEAEWRPVREIFAAYCVQCHNPEGVAGLPSLDNYRSAARLARLPEPEPVALESYVAPAGGLLVSMLLAGWSVGRGGRRHRER